MNNHDSKTIDTSVNSDSTDTDKAVGSITGSQDDLPIEFDPFTDEFKDSPEIAALEKELLFALETHPHEPLSETIPENVETEEVTASSEFQETTENAGTEEVTASSQSSEVEEVPESVTVVDETATSIEIDESEEIIEDTEIDEVAAELTEISKPEETPEDVISNLLSLSDKVERLVQVCERLIVENESLREQIRSVASRT